MSVWEIGLRRDRWAETRSRLDDVEVGSPALGVGSHGYRRPVPGEALLSGGPLVLATGHQAPK